MMTIADWIGGTEPPKLGIITAALPAIAAKSIEEGPVQEPPRAVGLFRAGVPGIRVLRHMYDDGLAEIEWTIRRCIVSARGQQYLGDVYGRSIPGRLAGGRHD